MRLICVIALGVLLTSVGHADQHKAHQEGKSFAKQQHAKVKNGLQTFDVKKIPGYQTDQPAEAGMDVHELESRKSHITKTNEHAKFLAKTLQEKPKVKIDPVNDPIIKHAQEAASKPLDIIAGDKGVEVKQLNSENTQESRHTCEESVDVNYTCQFNRFIKVNLRQEKKTYRLRIADLGKWQQLQAEIHSNSFTPAYYALPAGHKKYFQRRNYLNLSLEIEAPKDVLNISEVRLIAAQQAWIGVNAIAESAVNASTFAWRKDKTGKHSWISGHPSVIADVEVTYTTKPAPEDIIETETSNCDWLEEKSDQGICSYGEETILEHGPKTIEGLSINREWWKKSRTYTCTYPSLNNCEPYRLKGCAQIGTNCKELINGLCAVSEHRFVCRKSLKKVANEKITGKSIPFCLDGTCSDATYEPNEDMMEAVSRLAVLNEMQGQITEDNLNVFKGSSRACKRQIVNFKDCCGSGKGWGKSLGLTSCSADEKLLAEARSKNLCHRIGTFCSKKKLGQCVTKKTSFCCFPSKLAKIFHEQGRSQLGTGWGSAKHPDCRGLTVEEISKIDFSKLDLQDIYSEISSAFTNPDFGKVKDQLQSRVDVMVLDSDKKKQED